jgi:hypothetical protein
MKNKKEQAGIIVLEKEIIGLSTIGTYFFKRIKQTNNVNLTAKLNKYLKMSRTSLKE